MKLTYYIFKLLFTNFYHILALFLVTTYVLIKTFIIWLATK